MHIDSEKYNQLSQAITLGIASLKLKYDQDGFISESEYRQELNYLEDWYYYSDIDCSPYKLY